MPLEFDEIIHPETMAGAYFSECRAFRYTLWRRWSFGEPISNMVAFIGLNPSTANEWANDPTVKRCINFAKDWGFGGMIMLNLFAIRATQPDDMKLHPAPIGPLNDWCLIKVAEKAAMIVTAWGNDGSYLHRSDTVVGMLSQFKNLRHLGFTKQGHPKHPLYLSSATQPINWNSP